MNHSLSKLGKVIKGADDRWAGVTHAEAGGDLSPIQPSATVVSPTTGAFLSLRLTALLA